MVKSNRKGEEKMKKYIVRSYDSRQRTVIEARYMAKNGDDALKKFEKDHKENSKNEFMVIAEEEGSE